ncbi:MAG: rhomboid family intramembrane serine protease [Gammaproteobacteria bacterium]|nr:rhomboid family intramembrane serine protease [Gammaproteobacteria bacterium]
MFFIPYSTELKLNKLPVVTYAVMIICSVIFFLQYQNNSTILQAATLYCQSLSEANSPGLNESPLNGRRECVEILTDIHVYLRDDWDLQQFISDNLLYSGSTGMTVKFIEKHYLIFSEDLISGLNKSIMYYPDSWNPLKMITSSLAHGDLGHIFFNLLFFFAFTPALEILISNSWKFIKALLLIAFSTHITYSLISIGTHPVPTLGLSGVVSGMIGLAAYLMPEAKIRVFVWFFTFLKTVYIPAWILALWYIGWDSWDLLNDGNNGGVNLIAHVSGGITGYFLGKLWFKERRQDIKDELKEEINYRRYSRNINTFDASYIGGKQQFDDRIRSKNAERECEAHLSKLYTYVQTERDSDAVVLLLDDFEYKQGSVEIYEELFDRMSQWQPSRAFLCVGRLVIYLLLNTQRFSAAVSYAEKCQLVSKDFVLAQAGELILLTQSAIKLQKYELAYCLINNANSRYNGEFDAVHCRLLEIELLWYHLEAANKARDLMKQLLALKPVTHRQEIMQLATQMQG